MNVRSTYTDEEWQLLTRMPTLAAFGAMASHEGGPVASTRELWAGMRELVEAARDDYPDNALIQAVTKAITRREDGAELSLEDWQARRPGELPAAIVEQTLQTAAEARQALAERATADETAQYMAWIMGIARAGIEASKTGFLGIGGRSVTPKESQFLDELAAALAKGN